MSIWDHWAKNSVVSHRALVVSMFILSAAAWSRFVPVFEKPDEINHYAYARYIADELQLPRQVGELNSFLELELQQPPMYYALAALTLIGVRNLGVELIQLEEWYPRVNENFEGKSPGSGDLNFWIWHKSSELQTEVFAPDVLILRLLSVGIAIIPIVATHELALMVIGRRKLAIIPPLLLAISPQYGFISSSVSNDPLAWAVASIAILLVYRIKLSEADATVTSLFAQLAVVIGIGLLTKATLYPLFVGLVAVALVGRPRGNALRLMVVIGLIALAIGGWWFVRSEILYGDPLGRQELISPAEYRWNVVDRNLLSSYFRESWFWVSLVRSSIGVFGVMSIVLPGWYYGIVVAAFLVATAVSVNALLSRFATPLSPADRALVWLQVAPISALIGLVVYNLSVTQSQGRLLFHALPVVATTLVVGALDEGASSGSTKMLRVSRMSLGVLILALLLGDLYSIQLVRHVFWQAFLSIQ